MLQPESSMRSETVALESECQRLQLLVGELLLKNHELRCEVARLRDALDAKAPQANKVHMPPVRFAVLKTILIGKLLVSKTRWVPQVSPLRPGILATNFPWKTHFHPNVDWPIQKELLFRVITPGGWPRSRALASWNGPT
jgi:hypothetical protein